MIEKEGEKRSKRYKRTVIRPSNSTIELDRRKELVELFQTLNQVFSSTPINCPTKLNQPSISELIKQ